jgi:hypothetical protein
MKSIFFKIKTLFVNRHILIDGEASLLKRRNKTLEAAYRPLREGDNAATTPSPRQLGMALVLHALADDVVNLGGRNAQFLQVGLVQVDVVPETIQINLRLFDDLKKPFRRITQRVHEFFKLVWLVELHARHKFNQASRVPLFIRVYQEELVL